MKQVPVFGLVVWLVVFLAGCSVFMAAKKEGVAIEDLTQCKTRGCLISKGAEPVDTKKDENGCVVEEIFKCMHPKGSSGRAAMHGILDVCTLGLWEIAGTPIEGSKGEKRFYSIKAYYEGGEDIAKIELVQ